MWECDGGLSSLILVAQLIQFVCEVHIIAQHCSKSQELGWEFISLSNPCTNLQLASLPIVPIVFMTYCAIRFVAKHAIDFLLQLTRICPFLRKE